MNPWNSLLFLLENIKLGNAWNAFSMITIPAKKSDSCFQVRAQVASWTWSLTLPGASELVTFRSNTFLVLRSILCFDPSELFETSKHIFQNYYEATITSVVWWYHKN